MILNHEKIRNRAKVDDQLFDRYFLSELRQNFVDNRTFRNRTKVDISYSTDVYDRTLSIIVPFGNRTKVDTNQKFDGTLKFWRTFRNRQKLIWVRLSTKFCLTFRDWLSWYQLFGNRTKVDTSQKFDGTLKFCLSNFSKLTQKSIRTKNSTELEVLTYFSPLCRRPTINLQLPWE